MTQEQNLIIGVSSFNNYDMLEFEVLKNIDFEDFEFINIDDHSRPENVKRGKALCEEKGIEFIINEGKGLQQGVDTLMKFVKKNRPNCKWVVMFQHDNYPLSKNFFKRLSNLISSSKLPNNIAVLGFNNLDYGEYTRLSYFKWRLGLKPIGLVGKFHLSIKSNSSRWAAPAKNHIIRNHSKNFKKPFLIEIPLEAAMAISVDAWLKNIEPSDKFIFHLWFPDVMMQFMKKNLACLVLPDLYCMNNQYLKLKYGISKSSADGGRSGETEYFEEYGPHLEFFQERWGWDYENTENFPKTRYEKSLLMDFFNHKIEQEKKPIKSYDIEY